MRNFVITSESVSVGHPDKLCDQIADAVIDGCLAAGHRAGVTVECAMATGVVFLSIRAGADLPVDPAAVARQVIAEAGYAAGEAGGAPTVMLDLALPHSEQEQQTWQHGPGQMVTVFGYATSETPEAMPYPAWAAHRLCRALDRARQERRIGWISPDAQVQVAVRFEERQAVALEAVAFRYGTLERVSDAAAQAALRAEVIAPALQGANLQAGEATRLVAIGSPGAAGPLAHSGLTGRKSADDAYGSYIRRAGPSLSGKDPTRIDRIANYAARHAARNAIAAGLAREIEVQLSYVIGDESPVSVGIDTYGSGVLADDKIGDRIRAVFDFRTSAIAERMQLWELPGARGGRFYRDLAVYGHMGRDDLAPPWEQIDVADKLA